MRLRPVAVACMLAIASLAAHADPVTYTLKGLFSGSIDGELFTNGIGAFTLTSDTNSVTSIAPGFYFNAGRPAPGNTVIFSLYAYSINIATTFTNSNIGVESEYNTAAFYDLKSGFAVGDYSDAIGGYDLTSGMGPVAGTFVSTGAISEATTSYGDLIITGGNNVTFQADVTPAATPEPSSLLLLSTGLLGMAGIVRRRFARR